MATNTILSIGNDNEKCSTSEKPEQKEFLNRVKKHLSMLLMGIRTPTDVSKAFDSWEYFIASSIQKDKQPRRYQFHCTRRSDYYPSHSIIRGSTFNAKNVMEVVRKRLKDENWITDYVIEMPLRSKPAELSYCDPDSYIQSVVSDALTEGDRMIFQFVHHLHLEHVKKN